MIQVFCVPEVAVSVLAWLRTAASSNLDINTVLLPKVYIRNYNIVGLMYDEWMIFPI